MPALRAPIKLLFALIALGAVGSMLSTANAQGGGMMGRGMMGMGPMMGGEDAPGGRFCRDAPAALNEWNS